MTNDMPPSATFGKWVASHGQVGVGLRLRYDPLRGAGVPAFSVYCPGMGRGDGRTAREAINNLVRYIEKTLDAQNDEAPEAGTPRAS